MDIPAVFDRFNRTPVEERPDVHVNFMGSRTRRGFEAPLSHVESMPLEVRNGMMSSGRDAVYSPCGTLPRIPGEDFFEWIDVLEAVDAAGEDFNMVELGAGYGRWLVNAAQAVRRHKGGRIRNVWLCGLEASPERAAWMDTHFRDNGLDPAEHMLLACAAGADGRDLILPRAGIPELGYGEQPLSFEMEGALPDNVGVIDVTHEDGRVESFYRIRSLTLPEIVGDRIIDLIDIDVQGHEVNVLKPFPEVLRRQVRRLHIGTHAHWIEAELIALLTGLGFVPQRLMTVYQVNETPWGPLHCLDGIQSWVNPALTPT